ncbi:MAG: hypothetical protein M9894_20170 [Planctomycetes bacterium]|nr:hypothetical protein [Planctomycetota bacterium]
MRSDQHEAEREILECVRWCDEHGATVRWGGAGGRCTVEVLAPGTTWNLLRGAGLTLSLACAEARARHEAWAREAPRRPLAAPSASVRPGDARWSA